MSAASNSQSSGKKFRWRHRYLLLLPFLIYGLFEFAVDPFPNSLWVTRFFADQYFIHVQAELVVDGESLRTDRMIRCFQPMAGDRKRVPTIQAGDNVAFTTKSGRLFILPLLDVCQAPLETINATTYTAARQHIEQARPLRLSQNQLATPVVFEVHGGRRDTNQIDAYIARDRLLEGYHGVQLKEILLEYAPITELYQDWNGYEWFGSPSFARPYTHGRSRVYLAGYLVQVPKERWTTLTNLGYEDQAAVASSEEYRRRLEGYASDILALKEDRVFWIRDPQYGLFSSYQAAGFINPFDSLDTQRADIGPRSARVAMNWALNSIIPCISIGELATYECAPEMEGVLIYRPYQHRQRVEENGKRFVVFRLGDREIKADPSTSIAFFYSHQNHLAFVSAQTDGYLRR
jgi:hypothetical protein